MARKTRAQRRIEIIKDAKKQIELRNFISSPGRYVSLNEGKLGIRRTSSFYDGGGELINPHTGAQELLLKNAKQKSCSVCAKGAILLSCVRKENDYTVGQLTRSGDDQIVERLTKGDLFSKTNLDLIERYYEIWPKDQGEEDKHAESIKKFANRYGKRKKLDSEKRLFAIFRNMIRNNGIFRP